MPLGHQLPPSLRDMLLRQDRLIRKVRGRKVLLRGLSLLVLTALIALFLDGFLGEGLPSWWRIGFLLAWLAAAANFGFTYLQKRYSGHNPLELAALLEQQYPALAERMTTAVQLSQAVTPGAGSPALIELLFVETDAHARQLNIEPATPSTKVLLWGGILAGLLGIAISAVLIYPNQSGRLLWRFLVPWQVLDPMADFDMEVQPGNAAVALGEPVSFRVQLKPRHIGLELPTCVTLILTDEEGSQKRLEMSPASTGYQADWLVRENLSYRVEAGNTVSPLYLLHIFSPIHLAPDSPHIQVRPPEYAAKAIETESFVGLVDFRAFAHSTIALRCRFNRSVQKAWVEVPEKKLLELRLGEDHLEGTVEFQAINSGSYRLLLEAENGAHIWREGGKITVQPDLPPRVVRIFNKEVDRTGRPGDFLPVEAQLADDIAVGTAQLELKLADDGTPVKESMALEQVTNSHEVVARHALKLNPMLRVGQTVQYRIRIEDNRPEELGGPNISYYPATNWLQVRIVQHWQSLREEEILARKKEIDAEIAKIRRSLLQEQRQLSIFRNQTREQASLTKQEQDQLTGILNQHRDNTRSLEELANKAATDPQTEPLVNDLRSVAAEEMRQGEDSIQAASSSTQTKERDQRIQQTEKMLASALNKLDHLKVQNAQQEQDWLAQARLEELADRQKALSESESVRKENKTVDDAEWQRAQQKLTDQLRNLLAKNPQLKQAVTDVPTPAHQAAADMAAELAKQQRELAQASERTEQSRQAALLAEIAQQQSQLALQADRLSKETQKAARSVFSRPLESRIASQAAEQLQRGDIQRGLEFQQRSTWELDRSVREIEKASLLTNSPRETARQLARLQEDLSLRTSKTKMDKEPVASLLEEQNSLRDAALQLPWQKEQLQTPSDLKELEKLLQGAEKELQRGDAREAVASMNQASQLLRQLAGTLPDRFPKGKKSGGPLARPEQVEDLRKLADQQRELTEATKQVAQQLRKERMADGKKGSQFEQLARQQQKIVSDTKNLPKHSSVDKGDAEKATERAGRQLQVGDLSSALESAKVGEDALRQLASQLEKVPVAREDASKAKELAKRQKELNEQLAGLARDESAQRIQQNAQQKALTKRVADLLQAMRDLGGKSADRQEQSIEAKGAAHSAESSMKAALRQAEMGDHAGTQRQRQLAAEALERAVKELNGAMEPSFRTQAGQSIRQAQSQMERSLELLQRQSREKAQLASKEASNALLEAARQFKLALQSAGKDSGNADLSREADRQTPENSPPEIPVELPGTANRAWGELSGEMKTRILQQMRDRYGEDYARMIKLYFEQIADTRRKR